MTMSRQLIRGLRSLLAIGFVAISPLSAFLSPAFSQDLAELAVPEIRSSDLEQLDWKIDPEESIRKQSGERQLVSALLLGTSEDPSGQPDEMPWLTREFDLLLGENAGIDRICVDFSNAVGTFRATYLMKLITTSRRISLKVDYTRDEALIGPGGTFVAYPADGGGSQVEDACDGTAVAIMPDSEIDELVFPARVGIGSSSARRLFIKLNSGGADVSVRALDVVEQEELGTADCYVPSRSNGIYDRECQMDLVYEVGPHVRFVVASMGADGYRELTLRIPD